MQTCENRHRHNLVRNERRSSQNFEYKRQEKLETDFLAATSTRTDPDPAVDDWFCVISHLQIRNTSKDWLWAFPQSLWLRADLFRVPFAHLLIHLRARLPKSRQNSVSTQKPRQQKDGRHWGYYDSAVFLLYSTAAEPNQTTTPSKVENRSINDRKSHKLRPHRFAPRFSIKIRAFTLVYSSGHIGSNDAELTSQHLNVIQSQMQSKGGYDINSLRMQVC